MASEHICDKAPVIETMQGQIGELFERSREMEKGETEMRTTLFGAEGNGGGFIKEARAAFTVVAELKDLIARGKAQRDVLIALIGASSGVAVAFVTWLLSGGKAP